MLDRHVVLQTPFFHPRRGRGSGGEEGGAGARSAVCPLGLDEQKHDCSAEISSRLAKRSFIVSECVDYFKGTFTFARSEYAGNSRMTEQQGFVSG